MNILAVLVLSVFAMALGWFWYSQSGFGRPWMKALGCSEKDFQKRKKDPNMGKKMAIGMGSMFVGVFITMYVLALLIAQNGATSWMAGAAFGILVWFGFVVTTHIATVTFEERPIILYWIYIAYEFVLFTVAGIVLAVWR